jgi:NitT/TauT family transport system permease protein
MSDTGLLLLAVLSVWQCIFLRAGDTALASPVATFRRLAELVREFSFWADAAETGRALLLAMIISVVGGVAIGLALGISRRASAVMEPILLALYALPKVTLYPLVLLVFGLGLSAKVAFGAMHALVPIVLITARAILQLNPVYARVASVMHLTRWQFATAVAVPGIVPELQQALRLGFSLSLLGVLIGEMFASRRGLGFRAMQAMNTDDTPTLMAIAVVLAAIALAGDGILNGWIPKAPPLAGSRGSAPGLP